MKLLILSIFALSILNALAVTPFEKLARGRDVLCVNADNDHYFKTTCMAAFLPSEKRWSEDGAKRYLDIITCGNKVTHLFMCPIGQRANYDSKVCDPIWMAIDEAKKRGLEPDQWPVNAKKLCDKGIDIYKVWCDYAREKGNVSLWISQRMNDVHYVDKPWNIRTNRFWYENVRFHRRPDHDRRKAGPWTDHALDYAHKEVRDFQFSIFKELVDRYDADGFELDWMRFWEHLSPGKERELSYVLTDFIRMCRDYTKSVSKKRGHPIYLSVRVPTLYKAALDFGFDPVTWAREGLVDMIAIANFWSAVDFDFDSASWVNLIKKANPDVAVVASAANNIQAYRGTVSMDIEAFCAWGDNAYSGNVDGLYLFNVSYLPYETQKTIYEKGLSKNDCMKKSRRYVVTYHDCVKNPEDASRQLPSPGKKDIVLNIKIAHPKGKIVRSVISYDNKVVAPKVELNGFKSVGIKELNAKCDKYGRSAKKVFEYAFPAEAAVTGYNKLYVGAVKGRANLIWAEIAVEVFDICSTTTR
jgi:hypothetical protein